VISAEKEINRNFSKFGNVTNLHPAVAGERSLINIESKKTREIAALFSDGGCACEDVARIRGWMRTATNTLIMNSDTPFGEMGARYPASHEFMHFLTGRGHDDDVTNYIKSYGEKRSVTERDFREINHRFYRGDK